MTIYYQYTLGEPEQLSSVVSEVYQALMDKFPNPWSYRWPYLNSVAHETEQIGVNLRNKFVGLKRWLSG